MEETRDLNQKYPIDSERVLEWLTKQRILMVALENNLHQTQYTAKLMKIADFIGASITAVSDELKTRSYIGSLAVHFKSIRYQPAH